MSLDDQKFPDAENQRGPNPPRCHKSLIFSYTQIAIIDKEKESQDSTPIVFAKVGATQCTKTYLMTPDFVLGYTLVQTIRLHTCPKNKPDLGRPPHRNFFHQKNYDHLKNNLKNNIERVPIDSAHFYLHRGLALEPVHIANLFARNISDTSSPVGCVGHSGATYRPELG